MKGGRNYGSSDFGTVSNESETEGVSQLDQVCLIETNMYMYNVQKQVHYQPDLFIKAGAPYRLTLVVEMCL